MATATGDPDKHNMITVISGTNRPGSRTEVVAKVYTDILLEKGAQVRYLSLKDLPGTFAYDDMYGKRSPELNDLTRHFITETEKIVFIIPEYNGSFPGILKTFIDAVPPVNFRNKKAAIIGLSDGHAGNLRGQEHLTGILHYLRMHVHYAKPKISGIDKMIDPNGVILNDTLIKKLEEHAEVVLGY